MRQRHTPSLTLNIAPLCQPPLLSHLHLFYDFNLADNLHWYLLDDLCRARMRKCVRVPRTYAKDTNGVT